MGRVQKLNVYIKTFDDFAAMNEVYMGRFADPKPVSKTRSLGDESTGQ